MLAYIPYMDPMGHKSSINGGFLSHVSAGNQVNKNLIRPWDRVETPTLGGLGNPAPVGNHYIILYYINIYIYI